MESGLVLQLNATSQANNEQQVKMHCSHTTHSTHRLGFSFYHYYIFKSAHANSGLQPLFYVPAWHMTTNSYYVNTPADISSFHLWYSIPNLANRSQIRHKCHASLNTQSQGQRLSTENEEVTGPLLQRSEELLERRTHV